jgi:predicted dehydrogenase
MPKSAERTVACIGGGYWGKNLIRNFHALGALASICEVEGAKRERFRAEYPGVALTADVAQVLADPALAAVAIATPAETMPIWCAAPCSRTRMCSWKSRWRLPPKRAGR